MITCRHDRWVLASGKPMIPEPKKKAHALRVQGMGFREVIHARADSADPMALADGSMRSQKSRLIRMND
jgi:hypothetical protein